MPLHAHPPVVRHQYARRRQNSLDVSRVMIWSGIPVLTNNGVFIVAERYYHRWISGGASSSTYTGHAMLQVTKIIAPRGNCTNLSTALDGL